jgi:hypothetical protein
VLLLTFSDIDFERASSDLNDFLIPDENLLEILDIADDDELLKEFYDYENLLRCGTPLQRYTQDKSRPNKFGRRLLELCQNCSLYMFTHVNQEIHVQQVDIVVGHH